MKKTLLILAVALSSSMFFACRETTKEKMEDAVEGAAEETENALEEAGDAVEEAVEDTGNALEGAVEEVEEEVEN